MNNNNELVFAVNNLLSVVSTPQVDPNEMNDPKYTFNYQCDGRFCNFDQTLIDIDKSEVMTDATKRLIKRSIDLIDKNQGGFSAIHLHGYLFKQYPSDTKPIYLANSNPVSIWVKKDYTEPPDRIGLFQMRPLQSVFSLYDNYSTTKMYFNILLGINLVGFLGLGAMLSRKSK
jgi:hypothetical protein